MFENNGTKIHKSIQTLKKSTYDKHHFEIRALTYMQWFYYHPSSTFFRRKTTARIEH